MARPKGKSQVAEFLGPEVVSPILTTAEVARYLRVHPSTIYRLLKSKELPAFKVGSDWRFNREQIDKFVSASTHLGSENPNKRKTAKAVADLSKS